jgi:hypothetical protein
LDVSGETALFRVSFDENKFVVTVPSVWDPMRVWVTGVVESGSVRYVTNPSALPEKMLSELADQIEAAWREPETARPDVLPFVRLHI